MLEWGTNAMHIINPKSDLTPKSNVETGVKSSVNHSVIPVKVSGKQKHWRKTNSGIAECKCYINV